MSGYITLPADLNYSHTKNLQGKEFAWPSQELLWHTPWGIHIHGNQLLSAHSKSPAQKLVWFDLPNLDDLGNALQLPTDLAGFLKWPKDAAN